MPISISVVPTLKEVLSVESETLVHDLIQRRWLNGVSIGVWRDGEGFARVVGDAILDSRFELGSLTKLYTAELLAAMVDAGTAAGADPEGCATDRRAHIKAADRAANVGQDPHRGRYRVWLGILPGSAPAPVASSVSRCTNLARRAGRCDG